MIKETILKLLKLEKLVEHLTGFIEAKVELIKYNLKEEIAQSLSRFFVYFIILITFNMFVLFISLAVAFYISQELGWLAGFSIVSGFYLFIALVFLAFRHPIIGFFEKQFLTLIAKK